MGSILSRFFDKDYVMTKKTTKAAEEKVEAAAPEQPKEIPVAVIAKLPPHAFSVALNEGGKTVKHSFNSKEAMVTFLASRIL